MATCSLPCKCVRVSSHFPRPQVFPEMSVIFLRENQLVPSHYYLKFKDIELQQWMCEMNNNIRRDADQSNKMRTAQKSKTVENCKCEDYQYPPQNTLTKLIVFKQPQTCHRNGPIFKTL